MSINVKALDFDPISSLTFKKTGEFGPRSVARATVLPDPSTIVGAICAHGISQESGNKFANCYASFLNASLDPHKFRERFRNKWADILDCCMATIINCRTKDYDIFGPYAVLNDSEIYWRIYDLAVHHKIVN